ncbi:hypothetical protein A4G19_03645 [Pasteurellaceae bacterium Macca]|nr:hypothetical protein [Pasteurellaceae bacterium Macca]
MYAQTRKQMIQKIHIAKNQLKLDEEGYKMLLLQAVDKPSCAMMTDGELMIVLQVMKAKGFKVKSKKYGKTPEASAYNPVRQSYLDKIKALLVGSGKSWQYVHAICKRSFGKEKLQWCTDEEIYRVLQMLAVYNNRNGIRV